MSQFAATGRYTTSTLVRFLGSDSGLPAHIIRAVARGDELRPEQEKAIREQLEGQDLRDGRDFSFYDNRR